MSAPTSLNWSVERASAQPGAAAGGAGEGGAARRFGVLLGVFLLGYAFYGLQRCQLGVDFTDEGAYLAWPLRVFLGERPFSGDPLTLFRPIEAYLAWVYHVHPEISLYEFRLLGWAIHLGAFGLLAHCLFRLSGAPVLSPVLASVPFFVCHIFGNALPSYNTLSSDFLTIALSLRATATTGAGGAKVAHAAAGCALFVATLAHPALGLVAALLLGREIVVHGLWGHLWRRRLSASNWGMLLFLGCWVGFAVYFVASGAAADWWARLPLASTGNSLQDPLQFFARLLAFPFVESPAAWALTLVGGSVLGWRLWATRGGRPGALGSVAALAGFVAAAILIASFRWEPESLPIRCVQLALLFAAFFGWSWRRVGVEVNPEVRFLLLLSVLAGLLYAAFTYYFSPHRSWISGVLGLPFAFAAGFALWLNLRPLPRGVLRVLPVAALALVVGASGWEHFHRIQRDGRPAQLEATFALPKLARVRSTRERVAAVEALHAYLQPRLRRGEPLLAFDDCPLVFYLLDAAPAYGLTWAVRYTQSPATLRRLNAELNARPLPRYALRTIVDISHAVWRTAPRTNYADYPLNETLEANYALERTIFPFEVWRLKSPAR